MSTVARAKPRLLPLLALPLLLAACGDGGTEPAANQPPVCDAIRLSQALEML